MNWLNLLDQIFDVCLIPLLGVLTTFVIQFFEAKAAEARKRTENETVQKYLAMLEDTVKMCIKATNQTYVEALKEKNAFDKIAQKEAFTITFDSVKAILSEEVKKYLSEAIGDIDILIKEKIEANIKNV